jgi:uncharacterized membrane protein
VFRANLDLKLAALAAVEGLVVATAVDQTAARVVPAILLALVAPGYALSVALLPKARDGFERCLLALGLSICVLVMGGVILDLTPFGLTSRSWGISLAAFTLAACALAWRRRSEATPEAAATAKRQEPPLPARPRRTLTVSSLGVAAVAAMVVGAVLIARQPSSSAHARGFTALWAVPVSPINSTFSIGIHSDELRTTSYRLIARAGQRVVFRRSVTLRPGQEWLAKGRFATARRAAVVNQLQVSLYRADRPGTVYRHVYVTLGGTGS